MGSPEPGESTAKVSTLVPSAPGMGVIAPPSFGRSQCRVAMSRDLTMSRLELGSKAAPPQLPPPWKPG